MEVGVRQLRDELRAWLNVVADGGEVTITERGRPIARLVAVTQPTQLDKLIADGVVTPAKRPRRPSKSYPRVRASGSVSEFVAEQRR